MRKQSTLLQAQEHFQPRLLPIENESMGEEDEYSIAFRKLYYHFYTNSQASRAERIMTDLSNLLLCKLVEEKTGSNLIQAFMSGRATVKESLLILLQSNFPNLFANGDSFSLEDQSLRDGLEIIEKLSFANAPAHILGDAFQSLMGPRLRGDKGQFFTPKSLVRAIVQILLSNAESRAIKIVDPACGTGGFLTESFALLTKIHQSLTDTITLIGVDKDADLSRLAKALLEIVAPDKGIILTTNSLDFNAIATMPESLSPLNADYVFTNPPFGAKIKVTDAKILRQFDLGFKWERSEQRWMKTALLREAQDPQILFLELCIKLLKQNGKLGIILPEGVFGNKQLGYVWDYVRSQGEILALLDCPRTTFQPSTDIKTNVLFFQKKPISSLKFTSSEVLTAVALHCGHDRRGKRTKNNGEKYPDDFSTLGGDFVTNVSDGKPSKLWQSSSVKDAYYLVPRYYDNSVVRELQDLSQRLEGKLISLGTMVKNKYVTIRRGDEIGAEAYGTGDIPFIRTSDLANYEIFADPTRSVSEDIYRQYNQKLRPGDILMVSDGRYRIGRTAILHEHNHRCVVQSHIKILSITSKSPFDAYELLYLLNLSAIQHQIRNLVFIQSTLGSLGHRIEEIMIPVPSKTEDWRRTVEEFKLIITQRAKLLGELKQFDDAYYDL